MDESQVTLDSLLGEHAALRAHLNIIRGLTREWKQILSREGLFLRDPEKLRLIAEKRGSLIQAMGYLDDGLKQHHANEETIFPAFLGNLLWEAIKAEHEETAKLLEKVKDVVINDSIEKFVQDGFHVMQMIAEVCRLSDAHSSREDGLIFFLKNVPALPHKS